MKENRCWIEAVLLEEPDDCCRDWPFSTFTKGYPRIGNGIRVSHIILYRSGHPRPPPPGDLALHACDRPICLAPWHLSWGTQKANLAQAYERGRRTHPFILTADQIDEVREIYFRYELTQPQLAAKFGVSQSTISLCIKRAGRHWQINKRISDDFH